MAYDPNCNPTAGIAQPPVGPVHHHHIHRIVGRIKHRVRHHGPAAKPVAFNPDGCAKAPPRGGGVAGAGIGAGKIATLGGLGGAGVVGGLVGGGGHGHTPSTPPGTPITVVTPPGDGGIPIVPIIPGGPTTPVGPTIPPVVVVPPVTPPGGTPVPEPTTLVIFFMALAAVWFARTVRARGV